MRKGTGVLVVLVALFSVLGTAAAGGRPLATSLRGAAEVDPRTGQLGAGDPDAMGSARLTLNQGQGEICIQATLAKTSPLVGAHIHAAPAGSNGSIVVHFTSLIVGDNISGCVSVDPALVKVIRQDPQAYYLNVHSTEFPAGALRGQLGK